MARSVEQPAGEVEIELRAIGGKLPTETVEHLDRQAPGLAGVLSMIGVTAPISTSLATR